MKEKCLLFAMLLVCGSLFPQSYHWTVSNYQHTMVANCIVTIDDAEQFNGQLELGAFCGNECRGRTMTMLFPLTNQFVAPLSIGSNAETGEEITFRLYDHEHGAEPDLTCHTTIQFEADAVVGDMNHWQEIDFESNSVPLTHWNAGSFQYTMSVCGIIMIDDVEQYNGQLEVGAFCEDDCRGSAMAQLFPMTNQYVVPLSIGSNSVSSDEITFRLFNHALNQEMDLECVSPLQFAANGIVGNPLNWYEFEFVTLCRFIGTTDDKWSVSSNWKNLVTPDADKAVAIDAPCVLDVDATVKSLKVNDGQSITLSRGCVLDVVQTITTTDFSQLIIASGAQLLNNTEGVEATFEREIEGYGEGVKWNFITAPMLSSPVMAAVSIQPFDLYQYDEQLAYWMCYSDDEYGFADFAVGKGYLYASKVDKTIQFTGVLQPSGASVVVPLNTQSERDELSGYNLVGNPFPCYAYVDIPYYVLSATGDELIEGYGLLAPGQGVMVKIDPIDEPVANFVAYYKTEYPVVVTAAPSNVTSSTAQCGGEVIFDGGKIVTARGVCWNTTGHPTISDDHTADGTGMGDFSSVLDGLADNTIYFVRAYATNSAGTIYGDEVSFTTETEYNDAPEGAINGLFTINADGDQVYFSRGNLQYQASTDTWRFAENQWDNIGIDNSNISSTYNGWIDLFGWGTSGYNHGAVCYQPWSTSQTASDYYAYGNQDYNLNDQTGKADWGYNRISNGGNEENQWRTLKSGFEGEWYYLFYERNTNSGIRYAKARVNGMNGVILVPDDWDSNIYTLNSPNAYNGDFYGNVITSSDWDHILERAGCVFLPAVGYRVGISAGYSWGDGCHYWSSTADGDAAYGIYVLSNSISLNSEYSRRIGRSVRLVRDCE